MPDEATITFIARYENAEHAEAVRSELASGGVQVEVEEEGPGLLPEIQFVIDVIVHVVNTGVGVSSIAWTINRIIRSWRKESGSIVDARGSGEPQIYADKGLPPGKVVILTKDGDRAEQTAPYDKLDDYIATVTKALTGGAAASGAREIANKILNSSSE